MIYTPLTEKAMKIAYNAHLGQTDKAGVPYIFHPYHLAEQMSDEITVCVALLHDVVEDTAFTAEFIEKEFPKEIAEAVALLTHEKDTDYFEYIRSIKNNPFARTVKLADLKHNSDISRLGGKPLTQKDLNRLEKYAEAVEILCE